MEHVVLLLRWFGYYRYLGFRVVLSPKVTHGK